jgi:hypothetical protein
LCEVTLDKSAIEEVSRLFEQQIDNIFQVYKSRYKSHDKQITNLALVRYLRVEVRREGDVPSNLIVILDYVPFVTITPNVNTPPKTLE